MNHFNNRVKVAIVLYLMIVTIIYVQKPSSMFTENGECIPFGVRTDETLFPFPLCVMTVSIMVYYILGVICLQFSNC